MEEITAVGENSVLHLPLYPWEQRNIVVQGQGGIFISINLSIYNGYITWFDGQRRPCIAMTLVSSDAVAMGHLFPFLSMRLKHSGENGEHGYARGLGVYQGMMRDHYFFCYDKFNGTLSSYLAGNPSEANLRTILRDYLKALHNLHTVGRSCHGFLNLSSLLVNNHRGLLAWGHDVIASNTPHELFLLGQRQLKDVVDFISVVEISYTNAGKIMECEVQNLMAYLRGATRTRTTKITNPMYYVLYYPALLSPSKKKTFVMDLYQLIDGQHISQSSQIWSNLEISMARNYRLGNWVSKVMSLGSHSLKILTYNKNNPKNTVSLYRISEAREFLRFTRNFWAHSTLDLTRNIEEQHTDLQKELNIIWEDFLYLLFEFVFSDTSVIRGIFV